MNQQRNPNIEKEVMGTTHKLINQRDLFKIKYLNIHSLRQKINEIKIMTHVEQVDTLIMTEIWLHTNETKYININPYEGTYQCRENGRGGLIRKN